MKKIYLIIISILITNYCFSQNIDNVNTIATTVPFLLINPNAQSMGIGDLGVVASSDYYESGLTQNPALLSRNKKVAGFKVSYKPWLRHMNSELWIGDIGLYYSFNQKTAIGFSLNYYSIGNVDFKDINGNSIGSAKPYELYTNLRFAKSITSNLSLGIGIKYFHSALTGGKTINGIDGTAMGFAGDIGMNYQNEIKKKDDIYWKYNFGAAILNIGNKIGYSVEEEFLPICLKLGTMWTFINKLNSNTTYYLDIGYQLEKLLVPTPPIYARDSIGYPIKNSDGSYLILEGKDPNCSVFTGMYQSFYDAPGGFEEEIRELLHIIGIENRFVFKNKTSFAIRAGHLNEHKLKGDRKHIMFGLGVKYKFIYIDIGTIFSYKWDYDYQGSSFKKPFSVNLNLGFKHSF